jgi:hypothetical protein
VARHHLLHDREPDAGAGKLFKAVQALEDAEELLVITHIEPGAVVLDAVDGLPGFFAAADPDARPILLARIFDRVAQQIHPHLTQQRAVADRLGQSVHIELYGRRDRTSQFIDDILGERIHVDCERPEFLAPDARESEQVVDEGAHASGLPVDNRQIAPAFFIQVCLVVVHQYAGKAADRAQRRAQIVRHRIAEAFELPVFVHQLRGTLCHAPLQIGGLFFDALAQYRVLQRNGQLIGDGARNFDLRLRKVRRLVRPHVQCPDQLAFDHERNADVRPHPLLAQKLDDRRTISQRPGVTHHANLALAQQRYVLLPVLIERQVRVRTIFRSRAVFGHQRVGHVVRRVEYSHRCAGIRHQASQVLQADAGDRGGRLGLQDGFAHVEHRLQAADISPQLVPDAALVLRPPPLCRNARDEVRNRKQEREQKAVTYLDPSQLIGSRRKRYIRGLRDEDPPPMPRYRLVSNDALSAFDGVEADFDAAFSLQHLPHDGHAGIIDQSTLRGVIRMRGEGSPAIDDIDHAVAADLDVSGPFEEFVRAHLQGQDSQRLPAAAPDRHSGDEDVQRGQDSALVDLRDVRPPAARDALIPVAMGEIPAHGLRRMRYPRHDRAVHVAQGDAIDERKVGCNAAKDVASAFPVASFGQLPESDARRQGNAYIDESIQFLRQHGRSQIRHRRPPRKHRFGELLVHGAIAVRPHQKNRRGDARQQDDVPKIRTR